MRPIRLFAFALALFGILGFGYAASGPGFRRAASAIGVLLQLAGAPVIASSGAISEHDLEEINAMTPQDQALRLLEKTINHYRGAPEEIAKRADGWFGQIHTTPDLEKLTDTAYFSSDLRVRAAALEIWMARDSLRKNSATLDDLIHNAAVTTDRKWFYISNIGILGNRGVEPERAFNTLMLYLHDPDPEARSSAINGLALLGTDNTIAPLLDAFHNDTSNDLRERAACNLADSGMLSREQRQEAVPELIRFSQGPDLDATTKKWVYQALREITNQNLRDEPSTWVSWYGSHGRR